MHEVTKAQVHERPSDPDKGEIGSQDEAVSHRPSTPKIFLCKKTLKLCSPKEEMLSYSG